MRVLFLTQSGELGPSSRYRVYQLMPWLQKLGIQCTVSPAIDDDLYRRLYLTGNGSRRAAFAATWLRRRADVRRLDEFDAVFIQKGVFPGLSSRFESQFARKPVVFDFDDAIWLSREGGHPLLRPFHKESTVQEVLRLATTVIAGNEFLADYARRFNANVTVVPSAVDSSRYPRAVDSAVVGWIGSRTTLPYLKTLAPVFRELGITPRVIAAGTPEFPADFRPWSLETELDELAQLGVGLAPLPDSPWERGKCGVKILQYMACGIPVIASPVGVQSDIVRHGMNGFLAETPDQWRDCLRQLLADAGLRQRLGAAGRALVAERYDVFVAAARVANVLEAITQTKGITGKLNRRSA